MSAPLESLTTTKQKSSLFKFIAQDQISRVVKAWLIIGLVMVFMQVVIGGITRLTGSGLSITKWEVVTGTLPPLNAAQWDQEFELYKATPQYQKINEGMSMSDFKFIYFWEYFHRLWARSMGFVFLIPFLFFLFTGKLSKELVRRLGIVVCLAAIVAMFGWIMVKSGLVNRPWVSAYKLTLHLCLALTVFSYLLWTTFRTFMPTYPLIHNRMLKRLGIVISVVLGVQIFVGGIMSGMKAGLFYPTWPDMSGVFLPGVLFDSNEWNVENVINYDTNAFMPALIQSIHRNTAYVLTIMVLYFVYRCFQAKIKGAFRTGAGLLVTMLVIQILLGIITLINCVGVVPVSWGVLHQGGALLLLSCMLFMNYQLHKS